MKRSLLFTLLLATFQLLNAQIQFPFQLSEQSSDPFNENVWPSYNRLVTERNDFPALLMDTMYCESYWNDPPYDIYTLTAQAFTYNPQEQLIEVRRQEQFEGGGLKHYHTFYTYDSEGREISTLVLYKDGSSNFQNRDKTETAYGADGMSSEVFRYGWYNNTWEIDTKTYSEFDLQGRTVFILNYKWNGSLWLQKDRFFYQWHANGSMLTVKREGWDGFIWHPFFIRENTLDSNGRQISSIYWQGSNTTPLTPRNKRESTYDFQGRLDSEYLYIWEDSINNWTPTYLEEYHYNSQDELIERVVSQYLQGQYNFQRRQLLTYGAMVYSATAEQQIVQVWEPSSGLFLDYEKDENVYTDQPNDVVIRVYNGFRQYPSGVGVWTPSWACNYRFHKSTLSATEQAPATTVCTAPNPYPIGYQVQCPGLVDTRDYMLWVYTLDGRVAYARHFKGAAGWSIGQPLPAGMYVVAIQGNGQVLQTQRVVVE